MTSVQDAYTQTLRSGQDAVVQAFEKWTDTAKSAWANTPGEVRPQADPQQVIDQVFDFAEKMLAVQREFAKTLAATSTGAIESARQQSDAVAGAVRQNVAASTEAVQNPTTGAK